MGTIGMLDFRMAGMADQKAKIRAGRWPNHHDRSGRHIGAQVLGRFAPGLSTQYPLVDREDHATLVDSPERGFDSQVLGRQRGQLRAGYGRGKSVQNFNQVESGACACTRHFHGMHLINLLLFFLLV
ncbi:hypothetical protein D3C84_969690 [compost metagenome]